MRSSFRVTDDFSSPLASQAAKKPSTAEPTIRNILNDNATDLWAIIESQDKLRAFIDGHVNINATVLEVLEKTCRYDEHFYDKLIVGAHSILLNHFEQNSINKS